MDFTELRGVLIDMDGVLWRGSEPLPGLVAFFEWLRARNLEYGLVTNNSTKTPADYAAKLAQLGVRDVPDARIVTSSSTTAHYLRAHYPPGTPVHVLGMDGLRRLVQAAGMTLADEGARAVVIGIDFELTYDKLKRATFILRAGADYIATNADATFPLPDGLAPGAGSLVAALSTASGRQPLVMGKPGAPMFEAALAALGTPPAQTVMIGDRLDTDIAGAAQNGLRSILVLTGVATRADLAASPARPDAVFDDLPALMRAWDSR